MAGTATFRREKQFLRVLFNFLFIFVIAVPDL